MYINKKMNLLCDSGVAHLRVFRRRQRGTVAARTLVKCGDCDKAIEIYHADDSLEINGVNGTIGDWRAILFPLLKNEPIQ